MVRLRGRSSNNRQLASPIQTRPSSQRKPPASSSSGAFGSTYWSKTGSNVTKLSVSLMAIASLERAREFRRGRILELHQQQHGLLPAHRGRTMANAPFALPAALVAAK